MVSLYRDRKPFKFRRSDYLLRIKLFFPNHYNREETIAKLMNQLESLDKTGRVLMVTHQVVISAITGINVASGVAVAYNLSDGSAVKLSMR